MTFKALALSTAFCALLAPAAFSKTMQMQNSPGMMQQSSGMMMQKPMTKSMMSDGNIASIDETINNGEIKLAKLALQKSKNTDVRGYAELIIADHQSMQQSGMQLFASLKIKPTSNPTSNMLKKEGNSTFAMLQKTKGASFDKKYLEMNATMHGKVASLIETKLIPSAQTQDVKSELSTNLRAVQVHEQKAKDLLASMSTQPSQM